MNGPSSKTSEVNNTPSFLDPDRICVCPLISLTLFDTEITALRGLSQTVKVTWWAENYKILEIIPWHHIDIW